ncbi:ABC transporter substrate-binding protein [Aureimonas frigidaquae]|uniref:ABC-type dipeptide transport system, periplasmic component n=1 Tax=Aureimonas frigidaquae TaxID=424757 RepID=A0A0P0Z3C8_9HYPH|nr:ABC transporter substrate-binding protein [Aureimonas frigidaquae]BAT28574.1 ABC-type dipeptide transport system, periplasmic component precursor [Aureimonas frigidaquae]
MTKLTHSILASMLASLISTTAMAQVPAPAGTLTVAVGADPETFDPHFNDLPTGNTVDLHVLEGLFRLDAENNVVNELATEHAFSEDGRTFTVKIKEGRTFSNGNPLDAEAVAASFNRLLDPAVGSIYRGLYSSIERVSAEDPTTVVFHLAEPNGHVLLLLSSTNATIIDTKALAEMGAEYSRKPVGSGPYMVDSFVGGERYRLVPNPTYSGDFPATLEAIDFLVVPEDGSRMALLETGEVDVAERVPPESIETISSLDGMQVMTPPSMFSINMEIVMKGPMGDPRVREALNLAVDREGMIQGILGGLATPSVTMPGPGTQNELRVTFDPIPFDPERAKALIEEAGYAPGELSITMVCPNGRYIKDAQICQALQGSFQAIGVTAAAQVVDRGTWTEIVSQPVAERTDNMAMLGRATAGMDYTLYRLFKSGVSANTTGYASPEVDALLAEGRAETDVARQKDIYGQIQRKIWEDRPFVFLWYQTQAIGIADRVTGLEIQPNETMHFDKVAVSN